MTDSARQMYLDKAESLASQGLRVIAVGQRRIPLESVANISREETEQSCTILGLIGIIDPPRPETLGAVRACKEAGIVVHM